MVNRFPFPLIGLVLPAIIPAASAQLYEVGDMVENFTLTDRNTDAPVSLYDFEGKVIFLEWFVYWCPFCQAAAAQTGPQIHEFYESAGGNRNGAPVVHVNLNLQGGQESQTQAFIDFYGLGIVLNDFNRSAASRFQFGGQPIFAIINGVANSPSHQQWELVYSRLGYGNLAQPIQTFRSAIDSVKAAAPVAETAPKIIQHPVSQIAGTGAAVTFSAAASSEGTLAFAWWKDGTPIADATAAELVLSDVTSDEAGDYTVAITNAAGTTTSRPARLTVGTAIPGRVVNLSVRALAGRDGQPLIVGFVVDGGAKQVLIRGIGPTLGGFGVEGALTDSTLVIDPGPLVMFENDNWADNGVTELAMAFEQVGAFPLMSESLDASLLAELTGAHTAHINGKNGDFGISLAEVYDAAEEQPARLVNVSARNHVGEGDGVLVAGFVISGNEPKTVMVRAAGPALEQFGITGFLEDPVLEIFEKVDAGDDVLFAANDNWSAEPNASEVPAAVEGAFEFEADSKDAALLLVLPAGSYTAIARGADNTTGEALVEIYEVP